MIQIESMLNEFSYVLCFSVLCVEPLEEAVDLQVVSGSKL